MKTLSLLKKSMLMLCALLMVASCSYDDDELWSKVNNHEERISALEDWQKQVNSNITALQELLNTMDYITKVSPLVENGVEVGYTIEFAKSDPITLYHGKKGESGDAGNTPIISLTKEKDGNWYWTLNGELMKDEKGNPIRANGEDGKDGADGEDGKDGQDGHNGSTGATGPAGRPAPTPQISLGSKLSADANIANEDAIDASAVYLSVDGGSTWYRISGEKGETGSSGSAGEDNQGITVTLGTDYVTFTLENGDSFNVPYYGEAGDLTAGFMIYDKDNPATLDNNDAITIEITQPTIYWAEQLYFKYPNGLEREDVSSVIAEIIGQTEDNSSDAPDNNFATRASDGDKKIGIFVDTDDKLEGPNYYIYIKHKGMASGDTYMIRATLTKSDGSTLVTTRAIRFMEQMKVGDILYSDGSYSTNLISGKTAIGIIFSLDPNRIGEAEKAALEAKGVTPKGLAMALSDATVPGNINYHNSGANPSSETQTQSDYNLLWCAGNDPEENEGLTINIDPDKSKPAMYDEDLTNCFTDEITDITTLYNDISGLKNSQTIWENGKYGDIEKYPAFYAAKRYADDHNSELPEGTTGWFLPSMGQWADLLANLANVSFETTNFNKVADFFSMQNKPDEDIDDAINAYFGKISNNAKLNVFNNSCDYHTSSEGDADNGSQIKLSTKSNSLYLSFDDKDAYSKGNGECAYRVRCILAF